MLRKERNMKKISVLLAAAAMTVCSLLLLASCAGENGGETTSAPDTETTTINQTHNTPDLSIPDFDFQKDFTTLKEVETAGLSETIETERYTAETTAEGWSINSGIDFSVYDYAGGGAGLVEMAKEKYPKAASTVYYFYDCKDASIKNWTSDKVNNTTSVLAFFDYNTSNNKLRVFIQNDELRVRPAYSSVTAGSGYYISLPFDSNLPGEYRAVISQEVGSTAEGVSSIDGVAATGSDGRFGGNISFTVPFVASGDYYVNIIANSGSDYCLASIPLKIEKSDFSDMKYHLLFSGDWDLITDSDYQNELLKLFYNTYPRLYARWGTGSEPKTVTFIADKSYDGVAYSSGQTVVVSVDYANSNPLDIGFFSHEITHQVQQYIGFDSDWWVENMANYGGFRYFHWSNAKYVQVYKSSDKSLQDWGYEPYGNNKWFFAYMDSKYPSYLDESGQLQLGLIDSINSAVKKKQVSNDKPTSKDSEFNQLVKQVTGLATIEDVRLQFVKELKDGTWTFEGFGNYSDNFLTEDLPNLENPVYPMMTEPVHGDFTAERLADAVTSGDNLMTNAKIHSSAGSVNASESPEKLIDGNTGTKWCCTGASNPQYCLDGTIYWVIIDLGESRDFDTYTLYHTKTKENYGNMSEWELLVSNDLENWESVDYQNNNKANIESFDVGSYNGRYLLLRVYNPDGNYGTIRLYEFQLYKNN